MWKKFEYVAGEKIFGWNIPVKNSMFVTAVKNFKSKNVKKSEIGEKFQGKKLLWKILVRR